MAVTSTDRTIVFADICKSTQLFERHGDVEARKIIGHALSILIELITGTGGVVVKTIGDEVMATFVDVSDAVEATMEMHPAIHADPFMAHHGVSIKVGMHAGEVLLESNADVYGDAVNVAARLTGLAKADQIITTEDTMEQLPKTQRPTVRNLGPVTVRGKREAVRIVECLWEPNAGNLTVIAGSIRPKGSGDMAMLRLTYADRQTVVRQDEIPFSIGREDQNDLVVKKLDASRTHAHIEYRDGSFMLVDHSSNGSYVQVGNGDKIFIHRDHIRLLGSGFISLGSAWTPEQLIWYVCEA